MLGVLRGGEEREEVRRETGSKHTEREESMNLGAGEPAVRREREYKETDGQADAQTVPDKERRAVTSSKKDLPFGKRLSGWLTS